MSARKLCFSLWSLFAAICWLHGCAAREADAQIFMLKTEIRVCTPVNCRIEVGTGSSFCIGNIGERYYFVTAGHCCYAHGPEIIGSKLLSASVAIDGEWIPVKVDLFDRANDASDLAVLSLVPGKALHALPLAERIPPVGTFVKIGGFPSGSPYAEVTGNILPAQTGDRQTDYLVSTAVVRGVSGGPVICNGEAVGVVSASDFGSGTWVVGPEKVRARLARLLGRLPDCGKPRPQVPPQAESASPQKFERSEPSEPANVPPAEPAAPETNRESGNPGRVLPGIVGTAAGSAAGTWFTGLVGLAIGGPLGAAVGVLGGLLVKRLVTRGTSAVVTRAEGAIEQRIQHHGERWFPPAPPTDAPPAPQSPAGIDPGGQVAATSEPLATVRTIERQRNHYVDVPIVNGEAEALKEAMRLEAEFTKHEKPDVAAHLKRVQEMADMILSGKKITKPGWKI